MGMWPPGDGGKITPWRANESRKVPSLGAALRRTPTIIPSEDPMSTATPLHQPPPPMPEKQQEIKIVSHSNLFYWWPVWAVGFLMAAITFFDGHRLAIVPEGTEAYSSATVTAKDGDTTKTLDNRE